MSSINNNYLAHIGLIDMKQDKRYTYKKSGSLVLKHLEDYLNLGIGNKLRLLRIAKGLSQKELAAMVADGVDYTYIGKIEREAQLPSLKVLIRISQALDVSFKAFFCDGEEHTASLIQPDKVTNLAQAKDKLILQKELKLLYADDIPLLIEIVRALNRHRARQSETGCPPDGEELALVAEKKLDYEKDN